MMSEFWELNMKVGIKFGHWTIIEPYIIIKNRAFYCLVECECGTIQCNPLSGLRRGKSTKCKSCSAKNRPTKHKELDTDDAIKSGDWIVIELYHVIVYTGQSKSRTRYYICQCICKTIRLVAATEIRLKKSLSCGQCRYGHTKPMDKFGYWTVIEDYYLINRSSRNGKNIIFYICECICGSIKNINKSCLISGGSTMCQKCAAKYIAESRYTHKGSGTPEYRVWSSMRRRCDNSNVKVFPYYGGRGIKVCERWHMFENFLEDMGPRPPGYQIDRIDPDGSYEKSNCRWVTRAENVSNRRCSVKYRGQYEYVKKDYIEQLEKELKELKEGKL